MHWNISLRYLVWDLWRKVYWYYTQEGSVETYKIINLFFLAAGLIFFYWYFLQLQLLTQMKMCKWIIKEESGEETNHKKTKNPAQFQQFQHNYSEMIGIDYSSLVPVPCNTKLGKKVKAILLHHTGVFIFLLKCESPLWSVSVVLLYCGLTSNNVDVLYKL